MNPEEMNPEEMNPEEMNIVQLARYVLKIEERIRRLEKINEEKMKSLERWNSIN